MPHPQHDPSGAAGLAALTRFARLAAGADYAIAYLAMEDGLAHPLAADPSPPPRPFALSRIRYEAIDWSAGPRPAAELALPSAILLALDRPVQQALFIATPFPGASRSGVLLLWGANPPMRCACPFRTDMDGSVRLLQSTFGQMLAAHHQGLQGQRTLDRFHDLFETVPTGIVVLDGDSSIAMVNERAAALLGTPTGEVEAHLVAARMRAFRERCENRAALAVTYAALQTDLDFSSTTSWISHGMHLEVDTHPVLGHGRNGRIWLFHDVTARQMLEQELRRQAETDVLTGLANRRRFFEAGDAANAAARPAMGQGGILSVLLMDIDHFKQVNDRYGHPAGDLVIRSIGISCRTLLRRHDLMARIGGEEFAVLLPGTDMDEALVIAERLRTAVAASPIETPDGEITITISLGCTTGTGLQSFEALVKQADDRLYEAKRAGRNRVGALHAHSA